METRPDKPGLRVRNRLRMLRHLADTAERLFDSQGYEAVTMEQIAAQADVARRTLYNHFSSKEAVLAYWVEAELARDLVHLQGEVEKRKTFRGRMSYVLEASADWCEEHPVHLRAYLRYRLTNVHVAEGNDADSNGSDMLLVWQRLIAEAQQAGELRDGCSADRLALWFHHLYLGVLLYWVSAPDSSLRCEFQSITRLFIEGAKTEPGKPRSRGSRNK